LRQRFISTINIVMYLKQLEIFGFKSFSSKSVLDFSSNNRNADIVAIVGPNGSGKSNIADAVRWVLGEQSANVLRSKKSEDIIFSGNERKPRSSYAEVTISLNNNSPIEVEINNKKHSFSEIEITRKAYRSGESEYLINHKRVRLVDVQELLAFLGFGQSTYTVIGQGMVDRLLFFNASEKKVLFDEAAGIKQYKIKREQAIKKLLNTDENMIRLNDILSEIEPRVINLRRLVRRAEGRKEIEQELKETENHYYGSIEFELLKIIETLESQKEKLSVKIPDLNLEIKKLRRKSSQQKNIDDFEKDKLDLGKRIDLLLRERDELIKDSAFVQGQINQLEEKAFSAVDRNLALEEEKKSLEEKILFLEKKIRQNEKEVEKEIEKRKHFERLETETRNKIEKIEKEFEESINEREEREGDKTSQEILLQREKERLTEIWQAFRQEEDLVVGLKTEEAEKDFVQLEEKIQELISQQKVCADEKRKLREKILKVEEFIKFTFNEISKLEKCLGDNNLQMKEPFSELKNELNLIEKNILTFKEAKKSLAEQQERLRNSFLLEKNRLQKELAEINSKIYEVELSLTKTQSILENQERETKASQKHLSEVKNNLENLQNLSRKVDQNLIEKLDQDKEKLEETEKHLKDLKDDLDEIINQEQSYKEKSFQEERGIHLIESEISTINQEITKLDLEKTRATTRMEDLREEMRLAKVHLINSNREEVLDQSTKDILRAKIENLRRKKDSVGGIDPETIAEYEELDDRSKMMRQQLEDLTKAKKDLERIISGLDQRIKNQFTKTFQDIAGQFNHYFAILFDGGRAELKLGEDDEGSLGVEISASPPGRRLHNLNALSGGERTLTSLALLFAILSVNPSPFCLLDEVDAALDESNTIRFVKILQQLEAKNQFVIITHNQETMKAAALLYGVTMNENHISKLISVKLEKAQKITS